MRDGELYGMAVRATGAVPRNKPIDGSGEALSGEYHAQVKLKMGWIY